jgi:hypothetical protein
MNQRLVSIVLGLALAFSVLMLVPRALAWRLPGNNIGYEPPQPIAFSHRLHAGELQVPCLYCHSGAEKSRHAGIPAASLCMNCHRFVTAPYAAVRAEDADAQKEKRTPRRIVSPELQKLYDALGLDGELKPRCGEVADSGARSAPARERSGAQGPPRATEPGCGAEPHLIWAKVHNVPDFVYFDHRAHVTAGVACQQCHGPVETMERMRQMETLTMGWCVNCHRTASQTGVAGRPVHASLDCITCHM